MFLKLENGVLHFADQAYEGFKPVVYSDPPYITNKQIAMYHWQENQYDYMQEWEVYERTGIIDDSQALNILLTGEDPEEVQNQAPTGDGPVEEEE